MSNHNTLCRKLQSLGIEKGLALDLVNTVSVWTRSSGQEWTVNRMKLLKNGYIQYIGGNQPHLPWIRKGKTGKPSGPFGRLYLSPSGLRSRKTVGKALFALCLYNGEIADKPTYTQLRKFFSSVETPPKASPGHIDLLVSKVPKDNFFSRAPLPTWSLLPIFGSTRVPYGTGLRAEESDFVSWLPRNTQYLINEGWDKMQIFSQMEPSAWSLLADAGSAQTVGAIGFIQEPGLKLRAVANPNRLVQCGLEPLKRSLMSFLSKLASDCTFDQSKGVQFCMDALGSGKVVHSVDLSDATNNFPRELQIKLMDKLGVSPHYLELFEAASSARWETRDFTAEPDPFDRVHIRTKFDYLGPLDKELVTEARCSQYPLRFVQWAKGQPLGLGPSFPAFTLAHHFVVRQCGGNKRNYRILGDDIVITDDQVKSKYIDTMERLGCPVSPEKTISSSRVAEFAGKVITPNWYLPNFKWREISDRNFLDIAHVLGASGIGMLRPRQKAVVRTIADLPEFLGGLGWNSQGKSLEQRLGDFEWLLDKPEQPVPVVNRLLVRNRFRDYLLQAGLPEKVVPRIPTRDSYSTLDNIYSNCFISHGREIESAFSPVLKPGVNTGDPRGPTTLELWESRLRNSSKVPEAYVRIYKDTVQKPTSQSPKEEPKVPKRGRHPDWIDDEVGARKKPRRM